MKKTFVPIIMLFLIGGTSAQTFSAEYHTFYAGQNQSASSFNLSNIQPGDQGKWVIEVKLNNTYDMSLKLNKTNSSDNTCPEPEKALEGQNCLNEGELEQEMKFVAWKETTGNLKLDQSEQKKDVDDWMNMSNPWSFLGSLSPTEDKTIIVRWELPENATNRVQTDSFEFDLVTRASSTSDDSSDSTDDLETQATSDDSDGNSPQLASFSGVTEDEQEESGQQSPLQQEVNQEENQQPEEISSASFDESEKSNSTSILIQAEDDSGNPVENAEVNLSGPTQLSGKTNSSGSKVFEVTPGNYTVSVAKEGYRSVENEIGVDQGEIKQESLELANRTNNPNISGQFFQTNASQALLILLLLLILAVPLWRYKDGFQKWLQQ